MVEVSICIISYNQEKFIAQAIDSALMQQCTFENEIIICDDCSTDETVNIIQTYLDKHPGKIKAYFLKKNIGMLKNWRRALNLCKGKYIALLEGDDYWNDKNKLQKQFEILEKRLDCALSFTNAVVKYETSTEPNGEYVTLTGEIFTTIDLIKYNFIPTCSVLMRNNINTSFFNPAYFKSPFADWIIQILNSRFGCIHFLNEFTCSYRVHSLGVWGGISKQNQLVNKLQAIECIYKIVQSQELKKVVRQSREETLQQLCYLNKKQKKYFNYIRFRMKLLFR